MYQPGYWADEVIACCYSNTSQTDAYSLHFSAEFYVYDKIHCILANMYPSVLIVFQITYLIYKL